MNQMIMNNMARASVYGKILLVTCVLVFGFLQHSHAQETWETKEGEIESAEVVISKERELTLPIANRNFQKIPPIAISEAFGKQQYNFVDVPFKIPVSVTRTRYPSVNPERTIEDNLYNHVKLGFGNFLSPLAEISVNSTENEQLAAGIEINHRSSLLGPVDERNSGNGETSGRIYGKVFSGTEVLSGSLSYSNRFLHYYGYPEGFEIDRDSIRQTFQTLNVDLGIESVGDEYPIDYKLRGFGINHRDAFDVAETTYGVNGMIGAELIEGFKFNLYAGVLGSNYEGEYTYKRNLIDLKPTVSFETSGVLIEAGVKAVLQSDSSENSKTSLFPFANAEFAPFDELKVYANVDGGVEMNTYYSLSNQNMFVSGKTELQNTIKKIGFGGGAKAYFNPGFSFHAGFDFGLYEQMPFFGGSTNLSSVPSDRFSYSTYYYNGDVQLLNGFGEISYSRLGNVSVSLRADYYNYTLEQDDVPWHMPNLKLSSILSWQIVPSFTLSSQIYYLGGIQAPDFGFETCFECILDGTDPPFTIVDLDDIIDVNLNLEYKINTQFSAFLMGNNLLGKNYERYLNYPVRGLQITGGIIWRF
ncbi:hypothetical protein [Peijinzhouia sedimentorum]